MSSVDDQNETVRECAICDDYTPHAYEGASSIYDDREGHIEGTLYRCAVCGNWVLDEY